MEQKKIPPGDDLAVGCVYFSKPGSENTPKTLEIAAKRASELGIENIVVSSTSGKSGVSAASVFAGRNLVVVTHSAGFVRPDHQQLNPELKKRILDSGARILTCQHALGGVGRAVRKKLGTYELEEIVAYTLRIFGEGTKVAVEIVLMAADAGLIATNDPCISIGGTAEGLDTALVLKPAHAQNFFDLRIIEFLTKPRLYPVPAQPKG